MSRPGVTIAITNYNGQEVLEDTLEALKEVRYRPIDFMLVDDGSEDGSPEWVSKHYPDIEVIKLPKHRGKASTCRNIALQKAASPYILLIDNDIILNPACLETLVAAMMKNEMAFSVSPRLVYSDRAHVVYDDGSEIHYLGVSCDDARRIHIDERRYTKPFESIPSSVALIHRQRALNIGMFDEHYDFGWGENAELLCRARQGGYRTLLVPTALVSHVATEHGKKRLEPRLHNRYRMILTMYSTKSLFLLCPVFVFFELCILCVGLLKGFAGSQLRALLRTARSWKEIVRMRTSIQQRRQLPDSALFRRGQLSFVGIASKWGTVSFLINLLSGLLRAYWVCIRRFV